MYVRMYAYELTDKCSTCGFIDVGRTRRGHIVEDHIRECHSDVADHSHILDRKLYLQEL